MFATDTLPEKLLVELVGELQEGFVSRMLVNLPGSLYVGYGGGSVNSWKSIIISFDVICFYMSLDSHLQNIYIFVSDLFL